VTGHRPDVEAVHDVPDDSLGVFVLGLEPPAERARLRAHLDGCPVCRAEWTALRDLPPLLASVAAQWTPRPVTGEAALAAIRTPPTPPA